jgi:hypothetical protein
VGGDLNGLIGRLRAVRPRRVQLGLRDLNRQIVTVEEVRFVKQIWGDFDRLGQGQEQT